MRIACGGFLHETNTFVPTLTTFADFERASAWPGFSRGPEMLAKTAQYNIAIRGFADRARVDGHAILPLSWSCAQPSGAVEAGAFEKAAAFLLADIADARPDAVLLELHGAMVAEHHDDAEGELLARVRALVGPDMPIVVTLDLHANVTRRMVDAASFISAYRTYPHVDWLGTGSRAAEWLSRLLAWGPRPARAFRQIPFLIPIASGCTLIEPMKGLYRLLEDIEAETGVHLSFSPGFPSADIHDTGATVIGYGAQKGMVEAAVDRLAGSVIAAEARFNDHRALPEAEAVAQALASARGASRPVIIADTQDNPGAGGTGRTTGFLKRLIGLGGAKALLLALHEPGIAETAHRAGAGAEIDVTFADGGNGPGEAPFAARARVMAVSDGRFLGTGPMVGGQPIHLGPAAWLRIGTVDVVVGTVRQQAHCTAVATHLGIVIADYPVIVVKSSVHFRADWQPQAERIVVGASPGAALDDTGSIPFEKLRATVRRRPMANA